VRLRWTNESITDLRAIHRYVARDDRDSADRLVRRIRSAVLAQLPQFPHSGRPGRVNGTRELVVSGTPYIVAYRLRDGVTEVIRVIHGSRQWSESF
jgi:toxin ParE1/3/4